MLRCIILTVHGYCTLFYVLLNFMRAWWAMVAQKQMMTVTNFLLLTAEWNLS